MPSIILNPDSTRTAAEVADALERAADAIDVYGHTKGHSGNTRVGFCLWGSLLYASTDAAGYWDAGLASQALGVVEGAHHYGEAPPRTPQSPSFASIRWNDLPSTQPGDVTDCLRLTAKDLRA